MPRQGETERERERIIIEAATRRKKKGSKYEYATGRRSDDGDDDARNEAKPTQTAGPSQELFSSHTSSELVAFVHAFSFNFHILSVAVEKKKESLDPQHRLRSIRKGSE